MRINKFLVIASIFLVSLLCISAVSAADDAASDILTDTNDGPILEESIDDADLVDSENVELDESGDADLDSAADEVLSDDSELGSFDELYNEIENGAPEVTLNRSYQISDYEIEQITEYENGVYIYRNVTINGNGFTIDGRNQARIFNILYGVTVVFKNINFVNAKTPGESGYGGAIWTNNKTANSTAINCTFTNNKANQGGAIHNGTAINCTFYGNKATEFGGAISRGYAENCKFIGNNATNNGGAMYNSYAVNCTFSENSADNGGAVALTDVTDSIFIKNSARLNGGAMYDNSATNCNFSQNYANVDGGAIWRGVSTNNCIFSENSARNDGGAICNDIENQAIRANNCTFTKNKANGTGGALVYGIAFDSNFSENSARYDGGALYKGAADNCNFSQNSAGANGGAIYEANASRCTFIKNSAEANGGAIYNGVVNNCNFSENIAKVNGGAIYKGQITNNYFTKNSAASGGAIFNGTVTNCTFAINYAEDGTNDVGADVPASGDNKFIVPKFVASDLKTYYNYNEKFIFKLATDDQIFDGVKTIISIYKGNSFVANYTALTGDGWIVKLAPGTYKAVLSLEESNVEPANVTITVDKNPSQITADNVTAVYNIGEYLVISLKDAQGNPLSGEDVVVALDGNRTYKTDDNGQVKINVGSLVPKTYTAKIKYAGNAYYAAASKNVKVVVKKAKPKLTAKKKTFKLKVKTKKYAVILKNNKKKAIKKVKLTLKVKGKTYKAKTNSKGKATFKIKNLKKIGTYKATVKFAGNKYYKKVSKKVKIKVKK